MTSWLSRSFVVKQTSLPTLVRTRIFEGHGSVTSFDSCVKDEFKKSIFTAAKFGSALSILIRLPSTSKALDLVLPECSDSITVLRYREGSKDKEVVIVGTAHISEDSANQVRRVIQKVKPSVVMIELDSGRLGIAKDRSALSRAGFDIPTPQAAELSSEFTIVNSAPYESTWIKSFAGTIRNWVKQSAGSILGGTIGQFYKSLEKLGFKAGGEFQAAVEEAKALNARVLLGDRDVKITLQRLAAAIASTDPEKYLSLFF